MRKTTETWLPVFPGTYGTLFEPEPDYEDLENHEYEDLEFDMDGYFKEIGRLSCAFLENELSEFVSKIEFQSTHSPKEYNFYNDSINCKITFDVRSVINYIQDHFTEFTEYIKDRYTSGPGFSSFHSNHAQDWMDDLIKFERSNLMEGESHKIGSVLEFICFTEEITYEMMYEYTNSNGEHSGSFYSLKKELK